MNPFKFLATLAIVAASLIPATAVFANGDQPKCNNQHITIYAQPGVVTYGTEGPDVILGTDGPDTIYGLGGNDRICAGGGDDIVVGGPGNDRISGGYGSDQLCGNAGNDWIDGDRGRDYLWGGTGNNHLQWEDNADVERDLHGVCHYGGD